MRKRKIIRYFSIILSILIGSLVAYIAYVWYSLNKTYDGNTDNYIQKTNVSKEAISLLLIGIDTEKSFDRGRADSIHLLTVNPRDNDMKITSIPRDLYVKIEGHNLEKINHSYAYGGAQLTKSTIEQLFCIPITSYLVINMQGFKEVVDRIGGIDIEVPFNFNFRDKNFEKGSATVNGEEALAFVRMRKTDIEGDIGRIKRIQIVIRGIYKKITSLSNALLIPSIAVDASKYVRTNIPISKYLDLYKTYGSTLKNSEGSYIKGKSQMINKSSVYLANSGEIEKASNIIQEHLGISALPNCKIPD